MTEPQAITAPRMPPHETMYAPAQGTRKASPTPPPFQEEEKKTLDGRDAGRVGRALERIDERLKYIQRYIGGDDPSPKHVPP